MELDINKLREEINEIDAEMVELFKKRMAVAASVAEYKKERGLPVLDAARERALLGKISDMAGEELDGYARTLYHTMLDVSRAYQYTKLGSVSEVYADIQNTIKATAPIFPSRARVACQGVEGAYSQIAAEKLFELFVHAVGADGIAGLPSAKKEGQRQVGGEDGGGENRAVGPGG